MTTADALLAAVCAAPADDLPRLVYADWCEENGKAKRAEFIRLQIERSRSTLNTEAVIRERVLGEKYAERWLAPLRQPGGPLSSHRCHVAFRRGFVEKVWMPARWFVLYAEQLFAVCPVDELQVYLDHPPDSDLLGGCAYLSRLRAMGTCDQRFGVDGVKKVCHSPHLSGLTVLELPGCNIDDRAADRLCETALRLDSLNLRHNPLSAAARDRLRHRFGAAVEFT